MTISKSIFRRSAAALALAGLCAGPLATTPAFAADEEEVGALAFFGLTAATGKTTLGTGAGELEANLLMTSLLDSFGTTVRAAIDPSIRLSETNVDEAQEKARLLMAPTPPSHAAGTMSDKIRVLPVADDQVLDFRALDIVNTRMTEITTIIGSVSEGNCKTPPTAEGATKSDGKEAGIDGSFGGIATAILGAMMEDKTVTGIAVTTPTSMLINAITSDKLTQGKWLIPSERIFGDRSLAEDLSTQLDLARTKLAKCKANAIYKADLERALALGNSLTEPGKDGAPSLIEKAIFLSGITPERTYILRVSVAKAGGSMVNRSSIWTSIGVVDGVSVRGGLAASWRLIKADDGTVLDSATVSCSTKAVKFGQVHAVDTAPKTTCKTVS